ncbi:glycosyltransferase family 2 protein [Paracoccus sp. p3-h83]|uniref:glycosyltransferase family 2 protein n=1 Tax=Paracoccus sp. p3-h83 TaxID=3342805 RepID=UPI0035B6E30E
MSQGNFPHPALSVVIPLHDEAPNLPPLVQGIISALEGFTDFEVVMVDDGSTDDTRAVALRLAAADARLRVIGHDRAAGQSAAVHSGVLAARGAIIVTLDGDGQNPPANLPALIAPLMAAGRDPALRLVAGQRVGRQDSWGKRAASRFANGLRARVLRDGTRDTGCGLKAFDRAAYLALPFFNHQHRYLPALFARDGWAVAHVDVTHAPRTAGASKYTNLGRAIVGISDLAGVAWLIRRRKTARPIDLTPRTQGERHDP